MGIVCHIWKRYCIAVQLLAFHQLDQRNVVDRLTKCETLFPHIKRVRVLFEDANRSEEFKPSNRCAALFNEVAW